MLSPGKGEPAPVYGHAFGRTTYERHQPDQTLLYQLVEAHYPGLMDQLAQQDKSLPEHVRREFEAYLTCGRLEHGFLRVRCDKCHFERLAWGKAGLPTEAGVLKGVHNLRHTFGRRLRGAGVTLETRKALLGHANGGRCDQLTALLEYPDHLYRIALPSRLLEMTSKFLSGRSRH